MPVGNRPPRVSVPTGKKRKKYTRSPAASVLPSFPLGRNFGPGGRNFFLRIQTHPLRRIPDFLPGRSSQKANENHREEKQEEDLNQTEEHDSAPLLSLIGVLQPRLDPAAAEGMAAFRVETASLPGR